MATIADHLNVDALRERYVSSSNAREARHFHVIWLLAKGHTIGQVAQMTSLAERWIEQLAAGYNANGPDALGGLRRRNGSKATILKPEVLEKLRLRLKDAPDDGGLWTSGKVAAFLAHELALEKVAVQRGWEALKALGWSIQRPRLSRDNLDDEPYCLTQECCWRHCRCLIQNVPLPHVDAPVAASCT